ncbi:MAG: SGNH/GDSL hydrolase family protein [Candidatus Gorgyraea atricola]|nr:SGNH/GDSL hydrolase family protein [Candidatus Gorgyraea atricola]
MFSLRKVIKRHKGWVIFFGIALTLVAINKGIKYYDRYKYNIRATNDVPLYALRRASISPEQMTEYSACGELELYPYIMFKGPSNVKNKTVSTNSFGFRGGEIGPKLPDTYRIILVGASTVFGGHVTSDEKTFAAQLERQLNLKSAELDTSFEVINASFPAFNSMQELILIQWRLLEHSPNMIIICDGFNDAMTYLTRDNRPGFPYLFKKIEKITSTSALVKNRLRHIRIFRKIMEMMEKRETQRQTTFDPEVVEFYRNNLDVMCHLLNSYNIKPFVVFQPVLDYKDPLSKLERDYLEDETSMNRKIFVELCNGLEVAASEVARQNNAIYLDSRNVFDGVNDTLFTDDCHFNDRGHKIVADNLYKRIYDYLLGAGL